MHSRIGFKDLLLFALLAAMLVTLWVSISQRDREWRRLGEIAGRLESVEQVLARMERTLGRQGAGSGHAAAGGSDPQVPASSPSPSAGASSASDPPAWARPGVPIAWQPPWTFISDPRDDPNFRPDGEFTELLRDRTASITPMITKDFYGRWITERVCEPLGRFDPRTLEVRGVLADAWQMDPDGRWLRVHLRPEARFSDGAAVTAEDVRWTIMDFVKNPMIDAMRERSTLTQIEDVTVVDGQTVEIVFNEALFTNLEASLRLPVLPKHFYSRFTPEQINRSTGLLLGSGMFKLAGLDPDRQWTSSQDVVLERNDQYWGTPPVLRSIRFRAVQDDLARLTALRRGEGDLNEPTSVQFTRIPKEEEGFLRQFNALSWINMKSPYAFIAWQCGERNGRLTPFADKRVRQAMTMLIDRERLLRELWAGMGSVATGPINPTSTIHNPEIKPWPHDPQRAAALLAEAGWRDRDGSGILRNEQGDPFEFELVMVAGSELDDRLGKYIRDECAKVGIRCRLRPTEWRVYHDVSRRRDFDAMYLAWIPLAPEPDPRQVYHSDSIREGGDNIVQWASPEADRLIEEIRRTIDPEARKALWWQFLELLHEEQPYTYMRDAPWMRFVNRRIGNVQPYPSGLEPWEFFCGAGQPVRP